LIDIVKLLWRKDVVIYLRPLCRHLKVTTVPVFLLHFQQIKLDVAFRT
jgi:hypothetical protein